MDEKKGDTLKRRGQRNPGKHTKVARAHSPANASLSHRIVARLVLPGGAYEYERGRWTGPDALMVERLNMLLETLERGPQHVSDENYVAGEMKKLFGGQVVPAMIPPGNTRSDVVY